MGVSGSRLQMHRSNWKDHKGSAALDAATCTRRPARPGHYGRPPGAYDPTVAIWSRRASTVARGLLVCEPKPKPDKSPFAGTMTEKTLGSEWGVLQRGQCGGSEG